MKQKTLENLATAGKAMICGSYAAGIGLGFAQGYGGAIADDAMILGTVGSSAAAGIGGGLEDMADEHTPSTAKKGVLAFTGVPLCVLAGYIAGKVAALVAGGN